MRNAVALGVDHNCLNGLLRDFELFRDLLDAHAIFEICDNRANRQPSATNNRRAALHTRLHFNQGTFRPVDIFVR